MLNGDRLRCAQHRMREQGIDAYMILTHDDYVYFFGEDRFQPRAVIPAEGPPIVITFVVEEDEVKQALGAGVVKVFGTVEQQIKDVVGVMREMAVGKETMTVGVQMWFNTPAFLLSLFQRANPKVKVVDIASLMDELRIVKDEAEIESMETAARIAAMGIDTAANWLKPGVTENDVGAEIEYARRTAGGQGVATPVYVNSRMRSGWLHGITSHKRIEVGDLVVVDVAPRYRGYCANITRTFVIGPASPKQREMHDTYERAQRAAIAAKEPGARNQDLDAAAQQVFSEAGYGDFYVTGISHSIGLDFEEMPRPTIHSADSRVELREGMLLTVGHSVLSVPGTGGVRIEDTFQIKDGTARRLVAA